MPDSKDGSQGSKIEAEHKKVRIVNQVLTSSRNEPKVDQAQELKKSKKHKVKITQDRTFDPQTLRIQKGDSVEWSLLFESESSNLERNQSSLYHLNNRSHVVSFRAIDEESDPIRKPDDEYKLRFFNIGVFHY